MRFKSVILSVAAPAFFAGAVPALIFSAVPARADVTVGRPAPALVVKDFKGHVFDLAAERGKWVIVNFWASWCPPCRAEMPMLSKFYRMHRGKHLAMIALSADGGSEKAKARALAKKLSYPAAFYTAATQNGFDAPDALPETVIVRPDGTIAKIFMGAGLTAKKLAAAMQPKAKK